MDTDVFQQNFMYKNREDQIWLMGSVSLTSALGNG